MKSRFDTPVWIAVPAAGGGSRMRAALPKQYLPLAGRTLAEHTLRTLLAVRGAREVVVAIAPDDPHWGTIDASLRHRVRVVHGGADRADSVWRALHGFSDVPADDDWVLVHDMARPCVTVASIEQLVGELREDAVGGLLAIPVADTLKRSDADGRVQDTVERGALWRAQTPQMFRYRVLVRALAAAREHGVSCSDESMAVELLGLRPRLVRGSEANLKVTLEDDLALAAYHLARAGSAVT